MIIVHRIREKLDLLPSIKNTIKKIDIIISMYILIIFNKDWLLKNERFFNSVLKNMNKINSKLIDECTPDQLKKWIYIKKQLNKINSQIES